MSNVIGRKGVVITFLVTLTFDLYFFSGMNLFPFQVMIVDIIANTVIGSLMAGVAALVLGSGAKKQDFNYFLYSSRKGCLKPLRQPFYNGST